MQRFMHVLQTWFSGHPWALPMLLGLVVLPLIGAVANWLTWRETADNWAAYQRAKPFRAALIRTARALLPHVVKAVRVWLPPTPPEPPAPLHPRGRP